MPRLEFVTVLCLYYPYRIRADFQTKNSDFSFHAPVNKYATDGNLNIRRNQVLPTKHRYFTTFPDLVLIFQCVSRAENWFAYVETANNAWLCTNLAFTELLNCSPEHSYIGKQVSSALFLSSGTKCIKQVSFIQPTTSACQSQWAGVNYRSQSDRKSCNRRQAEL